MLRVHSPRTGMYVCGMCRRGAQLPNLASLCFRMRREVQVQLALALVGIPAIFYFWRGDGAKWPNPLKPSPPPSRSEDEREG